MNVTTTNIPGNNREELFSSLDLQLHAIKDNLVHTLRLSEENTLLLKTAEKELRKDA